MLLKKTRTEITIETETVVAVRGAIHPPPDRLPHPGPQDLLKKALAVLKQSLERERR